MQRRQIVVRLLSFITTTAILSGAVSAQDPAPRSPPRSQPQLKIGAIYGLTGLLPDLGDEFLKGSELYQSSRVDGTNHPGCTN